MSLISPDSEQVQFYDLVVTVLRDDPIQTVKASCLRFINALISTPDGEQIHNHLYL